MQSSTPVRTRTGLGSFPFARRYLGNRCFFLFLALLRCFSSGGSPPCVMDSRMDAYSSCMRVSPFGYLRIVGYVLLPEAFRSLSRPSSAPGAKASALCSFCLTSSLPLAYGRFFFYIVSSRFLKAFRLLPPLRFNWMFFLDSLFFCQGTLRALIASLFLYIKAFRFRLPPFASRFYTNRRRQPPALPHRLQCSTIGRLSLNHRVRDVYGCAP